MINYLDITQCLVSSKKRRVNSVSNYASAGVLELELHSHSYAISP